MSRFKPVREAAVPSLGIVVSQFQHATGAVHYHVAADHPEHVFMVAFRTMPQNSSGVAHVLEHTVLCGSQRYPVRDPFYLMSRRSLNTFMNAFTGCDYTAYPIASTNRQDFYNLMDVYLDAVFFPRLDPLDFAQEGYRLEFEDPSDPATPLVHRGIVYNEMQGDMSDVHSLLNAEFQARLYPGSTYHFNSGGDPAQITALTQEQLLDFHVTHYTPANAIFMTYGKEPVAEIQRRFEATVLARANNEGHIVRATRENRFDAPVEANQSYAASADGRYHVLIGWLLEPCTDIDVVLRCHVLSDYLLDTSASPLRQLLESMTGVDDVSPLSGLDEHNLEMNFCCGVESASQLDAAEVLAAVNALLSSLCTQPQATAQLRSVVHQIELGEKEIGGDQMPFGLQIMLSGLPAAIHEADVFAAIDLNPAIARLKRDIEDPGFLSSLISSLLLENPHRLTLAFSPDASLGEQQLNAEEKGLAAKRAAMTGQDIEHCLRRAQQLAVRQGTPDDVSLLPGVGLADIVEEKIYPQAETVQNRVRFAVPTNGIYYHQLVVPIDGVDRQQLPLLSLYAAIVTEVGSASRGYLATQQLQQAKTGGLTAFVSVRSSPSDTDQLTGYFTVGGKSLSEQAGSLTKIVKETLLDVDFDEPMRVRELVRQIVTRRESGIGSNGNGYAMLAAASQLRGSARVHETLSGLTGLQLLKAIDSELDNAVKLAALCDRLTAIRDELAQAMPHSLCVADPVLETAPFVEALWTPCAAAVSQKVPTPNMARANSAWMIDSSVNHCAAAYPTVCETHPDSAALTVLAGVMRNGQLHTDIRERGGAYGAGASHDSGSGIFRLFSYRDPRLAGTLQDFNRAIDSVINVPPTALAVEEAILGLIAGIDAPGSPAGEARLTFHQQLHGRNVAHRKRTREALRRVAVDDVHRVAAQYLAGEPALAVVAGKQSVNDLPDGMNLQVW